MKNIVAPIATIIRWSSDRSWSTSTRSTMTCVKTGNTICSTLTTTARPRASSRTLACGRTSGHIHASVRVDCGACSSAGV